MGGFNVLSILSIARIRPLWGAMGVQVMGLPCVRKMFGVESTFYARISGSSGYLRRRRLRYAEDPDYTVICR